MPEIGQVMPADVVRVMSYGAIVRLEDGTVGLVHISELAPRFVEDIREFCSEGARVTVRVLRRRFDGRWEFSIKQVEHFDAEALAGETSQRAARDDFADGPTEDFGADQPMYDSAMPNQPAARPARSAAAREAFDEKLRDFLSDSSERIEDVRRHHDHRLHGKRR